MRDVTIDDGRLAIVLATKAGHDALLFLKKDLPILQIFWLNEYGWIRPFPPLTALSNFSNEKS